MTVLKRILTTAAVLTGFCYPLWAWWGLKHYGIVPVAFGLALIAIGRAALRPSSHAAWQQAFAVLLLAALAWGFDAEDALLFYPVVVNAFLLWLFASSLTATPMVERFARLKDKNLPPIAVQWCRSVTKAWCVFFVANGGIALATVIIADRDLWLLWNGCLSYLASGLMFAGEWLLRRRAVKKTLPQSKSKFGGM